MIKRLHLKNAAVLAASLTAFIDSPSRLFMAICPKLFKWDRHPPGTTRERIALDAY